MNAAKHTPGPWTVERVYITRDEPDLKVMAGEFFEVARPSFSNDPTHNYTVIDEEVMRANAHLLAAAPELLEACRAIVAWDEAEKSARPYDEDGGKGYWERIAMCAEAFDKAREAIAKATGEAA